MSIHRAGIAIATTLSLLSIAARTHDRRVVDTVVAGNATSEASHGYAGHDATSGMTDGKPYREARGWIRYALTTFDDTEVTLVWTFAPRAADEANAVRHYDVVVEDSVIATRTFSAPSTVIPIGSSAVVEIVVPFSLTKGRTSIAVTLRAHGSSTPQLRELRVVQDHNEQVDQQFVQLFEHADFKTVLNAGMRSPITPQAIR